MKKQRFFFALLILLCSSCSVALKSIDQLEIPVSVTADFPELILERTGYTVSFNTETNIPNWVAWTIDETRMADVVSRTRHFYPDPDLPRGIAVETRDYSNSGWDRGHMCPAADNKWNKQAMRESFYMTNICPQHHNLNRGDWKELEEDCRAWAAKYGEVYIACGPILYDVPEQGSIGKERRIRVPDAFFKVVLTGVREGKPEAVGFIFKNTAGNHPLDVYIHTIDEVERITGLDFFSLLPDEIEVRVESAYDIKVWQ